MIRRHPPDRWHQSLPTVAPLWPGASRRSSRGLGRSPALLVLPTKRSPRVLVPADVKAAGTMLLRHDSGALRRLSREALALGMRGGLLRWLPISRLVPGEDGDATATIEDVARQHVPKAARVGVLLGPPRANAKPVLQVFDHAGRTVAFGKIGHNELAAELVRREAAVLLELGKRQFTHLEAPKVIYSGRWEGLEVLFLTPLSPSPRGSGSWVLPAAATYELAESSGPQFTAVGDSPYVTDLRERAARVDAERMTPLLGPALDELSAQFGDTILGFGRWHGDWAPWNMGRHDARVQVWDWERSQAGVPLGFDVVHFALQREFRQRAGAAQAADVLLRIAQQTLSRWYKRPDELEATVLLYLVEILQRYILDAGERPTTRMRSRLAVIQTMISTVTTTCSRGLRADT